VTKEEREQAAVNENACPRCGAPKLNRCRTMDSEHNVMSHPHDQRVRLVKDGD
jgi:hypothetical protein